MIEIEENEEDELYFTPVSSTNLASLFNTTMLPINPERDSSLTYKPPKQPVALVDRNSPLHTKVKHQSSVILFKEVHAFQLLNKEYSPTGKCGFALIGNEQINIYQLLIYKQKNNIISTTKITPNFEIKIQKNNYVTIVDDKKLTWTIHMNNESDLNDFSKIIVSKCRCKIIKPEEKNDKPEELNEKNDLLFKNDEEKKHNLPGINKKKDGEILENEDVENDFNPVKNEMQEFEIQKNNIDNDTSDNSEATKKADILSRVAKMGKKVVPKNPASISDSSDVEDSTKNNLSDQNYKKNMSIPIKMAISERQYNSNTQPKEAINEDAMQTYYNVNHNNPTVQQFLPISADKYLQLRPSLNQVMVPFQEGPPKIVYSSTQLTPDQLNMFFIENRTQSSEMRMGLMKLQTGIDDIMNIIKKTDSTKYDSSTQTEDGFLVDITVENKRLVNLISEQEKAISNLKVNYETCKKKNEDLIHKETDHSYEIATLTQETARCAYEEHKLNLKIKDQQVQLGSQAIKLTEYEERLNKLNTVYSDCVHIKKIKLPEIKDSIKEQMNLFYNEACGIFKGDMTYEGNQIKKVLAPAIIDNTYKILSTINELFSLTES